MPIQYFEQEINAQLKNKRKLTAFLTSLATAHLPAVNKMNISFVFCDDAYLLGINQQFLNHDTFTDIITFDLSETAKILAAEIYISIERVKENAQKFNVDYQQELHRVIFHGVLHLCGFKDKSTKDKEAMREAENQSLKAYFNA